MTHPQSCPDWLAQLFDETRKENQLATLRAWSDCNSGSGNPDGLERMRVMLEEAFRETEGELFLVDLPEGIRLDDRGRETPFPTGKALVVKCRPEADRKFLLSGHYDTVYGREHPFQASRLREDGSLHGPGVADMKGGLLVMLEALKAFEAGSAARAGIVGWTVVITPDEEIGSPTSRDLLKELAGMHQLGLVFEAALPDGSIVRKRKGAGTFAAVSRGISAHTGRDFAGGRNAIRHLAGFIEKFERLNGSTPGVIFNTGWISGGGPVNVIPDFAMARFNIRMDKAADMHVIEKRIHDLLDAHDAAAPEGLTLSWHGEFTRGPKEIDPATEALFTLYRQASEGLGIRLDWGDTGGGSDGNILASAGLPTLDGLGVRGGNIHSPEEFMWPESIAERAAICASFLNTWAEHP